MELGREDHEDPNEETSIDEEMRRTHQHAPMGRWEAFARIP